MQRFVSCWSLATRPLLGELRPVAACSAAKEAEITKQLQEAAQRVRALKLVS
jgi:hypothetical protein